MTLLVAKWNSSQTLQQYPFNFIIKRQNLPFLWPQITREVELDPHVSHYMVSDLQTNHEYDFWVRGDTIIGKGESSRVATEIPMTRGTVCHYIRKYILNYKTETLY